jgi:hypothetical protein
MSISEEGTKILTGHAGKKLELYYSREKFCDAHP